MKSMTYVYVLIYIKKIDCGDLQYILDRSDKKIVIDHHRGEIEFGDILLIDKDEPATCQLVARFFDSIEYTYGKEIAECIISGVLTDTRWICIFKCK